jgi:hypothetical protein
MNRGRIAFDYNWIFSMIDNRRPFDELVESDNEPMTPENQSPRNNNNPTTTGRSTTGGGRGDQSKTNLSPQRRNPNATDSKTSLLSKKADASSTKISSGVKRAPSVNLDDTVKSLKSSKSKNKDKDNKESTKDNKNNTSETPENGLKNPSEQLFPHPLLDNELTNDLTTTRPDSQAKMRADSTISQTSMEQGVDSAYTNYVPFSVEPAFGKIEAGKQETFKVKFCPLNVSDYQARITCQIPNVNNNCYGPVIAVKGRGLLPYCHFELEESTYIAHGRRNPELPGPNGAASGLGLDPMMKVKL